MPESLVVIGKDDRLVRLDTKSALPAVISRPGSRAEAKFFSVTIRDINNARVAFDRCRSFSLGSRTWTGTSYAHDPTQRGAHSLKTEEHDGRALKS